MNRKKNGFTLIEILAVVTIISLICIIVLPKIVNSLRNKKEDIDNTTRIIIITAAKLYVSEHSSKFDREEGNSYCLPLATLTKNEYLESPVRNVTDDKDITNTMSVKISFDGGYKYEVVRKKDCKVNINEAEIADNIYEVGDVVTYNDINFYVIAPSDEEEDSVTLLKETPLTVDEVNTYGEGHINKYTQTSVGTAYNYNGYGGAAYYSSSECGYVDGVLVKTNCLTGYDTSDIKYIVDSWVLANIDEKDLVIDADGYKARLLKKSEYNSFSDEATWKYNTEYAYTLMYEDRRLPMARHDGVIDSNEFYVMTLKNHLTVRPVINLSKSAIQ